VEAQYNHEILEEQTSSAREDHHRGGRSSRRTPVSNALRTDGSPGSTGSYSDGEGRSHHRDPSPTGQERYQQRGQKSYGPRKGSPYPDQAPKINMKFCESCGCNHFEDVGFGVCKWRPTLADGKPRDNEFNGWDPIYHARKMPRIQRAMFHRMNVMQEGTHPAKMKAEELEAFRAKVKELSR
jgi:hypothetical protein